MKTNINLLHDEFRPKFALICGSHLTALVILVLGLCLVAFAGLYYVHGQAEIKVNKRQADMVNQQNIVETLSTALSERTTDPSLERKLTNLKLQSKERSKLLGNIKILTSLQSRSFSNMFDDLAASNSADLWLETFSITPKTLSLMGKLSRPNALPIWINELSNTQFFKGQTFNLANVERDHDGLSFELTSIPKSTEQTATKENASSREAIDE